MIDEFRKWLEENGKADNTVQTYISDVGQYLNWYEGTFGEKMNVLLHSNVLDYRSYLQNIRKLKAGTINGKLAALSSFNDFLIETGQQQTIATTNKDLLKVQAAYASPSYLTEKDVEAFRQAVLIGSGVRDYAIVTILAYAGLRISEATALTLASVDCVGREITVNKGKGNKERVVFVGDKVVHAVKEYLKERGPEGTLMFPGRYGESLHRSVVNKMISQYSDKITPHLLRHFFCSNALEKGYSIHEVASQAGHSNLHTTLRYTNPSREAMKEKANKL